MNLRQEFSFELINNSNVDDCLECLLVKSERVHQYPADVLPRVNSG